MNNPDLKMNVLFDERYRRIYWFFLLQQSSFPHAEMPVFWNNDVVNKLDTDQSSGIPELGCDSDILTAGFKRTRRMIMDAYDGRCAFSNRFWKNFARMDEAVIEQADRDGSIAEDFTRTIQWKTDKMLLPFILQVSNKRQDVFRACHFFASTSIKITFAQLETCDDLGSFCGADPVDFLYILIL